MGNIVPGTALSLQCTGFGDPNTDRILDGITTSATVNLIRDDLDPFTGARWLALPVPNAPSQVFLQCLGDDDGPRFLDGRTDDGTVGLAPNTEDPFTGTRWAVNPDGDTVVLVCQGASTGGVNARFLHGNLGEGTVNLVQNRGDGLHGTRWNIVDGQPAPSGGPGPTSATSQLTSTPSLVLAALGFGGPAVIHMAWQASDQRVSVMRDVLGTPFTVSLSHLCMDRPALAFDNTTLSDHRLYLAWTGIDQSINVMSSIDGLVFTGRKILPGRSNFGPAIAVIRGTIVVAWTEADTGELKMMIGDGPVLTTTETSSAAPALAFLANNLSEPLVLAWTGTNEERQLNIRFAELFGGPPVVPFNKTTLPSDGPAAATSMSGPSLDFKVFPEGAAGLVMSWSGLPGGPDNDNHLNIIFSGDFRLFGERRTVQPVCSGGVGILDISQVADADVFAAWIDKNSSDARINTAPSYNQLPVISA